MTNPMTGDFDAVLQVSGGTMNRLMASLHQNAAVKSKLPSVPHSVALRIGDSYAIDGVRGWMSAQVGVPRIELIHGVSDRFNLEVDVRARYLPDAGTVPIPEHVTGVIHAQYRIHDIDPNCVGWQGRAQDYLWFRVVRDSVRFNGSATDDIDPFQVAAVLNNAEISAQINHQIAALLDTQFEPAPHKVSPRFRKGRMRSLSTTMGGSALVLPVSLSGDGDPAGNISSLQNIFLDGHDFAIALRTEALMGRVEPILSELRAFSPTYTTKISVESSIFNIGFSKTFHSTVRVTSASASWEAAGEDYAILRIKIDGAVDSDWSLAPNVTFHVNQPIWISFDASNEALIFSAPDPGVSVKMTGIYTSQAMTDSLHNTILGAVRTKAQGLPPIPVSGRADLEQQLRTLDDKAGAAFQDAVFTIDGVMMRGRIWVSPRKRPVAQFHMNAKDDGFSAYEAWVPGGRIDSFTWKWTWAGAKPGDSATWSDRFMLYRPPAARSKWGAFSTLTSKGPLPGIDGCGELCLTLRGVQVNPVTGLLDTFVSSFCCMRYGLYFGTSSVADIGPLVQQLLPDIGKPGPPQPTEVGLIDVVTDPIDMALAANTLVVHFGQRFERESAEALERGLKGSKREDAGLAMIALFSEGTLEHGRSRVVAQVEELAGRMGLLVQVMEDVGGVWSKRFAIPTDTVAFRLCPPGGGIAWMHDGRLEGDRLARVLDVYLRPSRPARPSAIRPAFELGWQVPARALQTPDVSAAFEHQCPPHPLGRLEVSGAVITFAHSSAESSKAQLSAIFERYGITRGDGPMVIAVVRGDAEVANSMMKAHSGLVALADPSGIVARRFGIRVWPTTVSIDGDGMVAGYVQGFDNLDADTPQHEPALRQNRKLSA